MPWTRLDPARVAPLLRAAWAPATPGDADLAERALTHLREELLSGRYVAVQDALGRTFVGTPEEAARRVLQDAGDRRARSATRGRRRLKT